MKNIAILASHNGSGFNAIYKAQIDKRLDVSVKVVISNNTDAVVLKNATKYGVDNFLVNAKTETNPDETIYNLLKKYECEYVFLSGYMKKLSPTLTQNFKIINSHPSLLPKHGGPGMYGRFVHEAVMKNKETLSGVTIHEVNEVYDSGEIILQKEYLIKENDTVDTLEEKIKALEQVAIIEGLQKCLK